jgi:hypothetical protein
MWITISNAVDVDEVFWSIQKSALDFNVLVYLRHTGWPTNNEYICLKCFSKCAQNNNLKWFILNLSTLSANSNALFRGFFLFLPFLVCLLLCSHLHLYYNFIKVLIQKCCFFCIEKKIIKIRVLNIKRVLGWSKFIRSK